MNTFSLYSSYLSYDYSDQWMCPDPLTPSLFTLLLLPYHPYSLFVVKKLLWKNISKLRMLVVFQNVWRVYLFMNFSWFYIPFWFYFIFVIVYLSYCIYLLHWYGFSLLLFLLDSLKPFVIKLTHNISIPVFIDVVFMTWDQLNKSIHILNH